MSQHARTAAILKKHQIDLTSEWMKLLKGSGSSKDSRISEAQLAEQTKRFIDLLQNALQSGTAAGTNTQEWKAVTQFLDEMSKSRVTQGFSSDETAMFVFSFKQPLFARLRQELVKDPEALADERGLRPSSSIGSVWRQSGPFRSRAKRSSTASSRRCSNSPLPW